MSSDELVGRFSIGDLIKAGVISAHKDGNFGSLYPRIEDFGDDGLPLLTAKVVNGGRIDFGAAQKLRKEKAARLPYGFIQAGDVLLSHNATVGRVAVVPEFDGQALIGTSLTYFRLDTSRLLPRYLAGFFESRDFQNQLASVMGLSTRNQVPITAQRLLEVEVPQLKTQHRISEFVGAIDDRITLLRETNATLEAIAQALFKSWFVDFDPVHAKRQGLAPAGMDEATAALFPDSFEESAQGLVPKGWSVRPVGDVFHLTMGQSPPGDTYNQAGDGVPFYQGRTDFGFRFPTQRVFCTAPTRMANAGDTLVSVRAPVGDVNMALEGCSLGRGVAGVRHPLGYRGFTFHSVRMLKRCFEVFDSEGTVFGSINRKDFEALPTVAPADAIVKEFEAVTTPIDERVITNELQVRTLSTLRDTLLPRLISGQLQLPDADAILDAH
jgi:type I restriction enzyme S subunit